MRRRAWPLAVCLAIALTACGSSGGSSSGNGSSGTAGGVSTTAVEDETDEVLKARMVALLNVGAIP